MRAFIALVLIVYLVGVGVMLAPTMQTKWTTVPASELFAGLWQELPRALAWPVVAYHHFMDAPPEKP
jgi:hypothetical protein